MNAKVLIVDDQRDLLDLLSMALTQQGYIVRTAASGAEAIEAIAADKPDLILLDIMLGDISGIKLTTRWKNDAQTAHIPIILLTAKDSETDIIVGLSVGADDYITKPFSTPILLARMEAVLRRAYPESPAVQEILSAGPIRLFPAGRQAFVQGSPVDLTGAEFNLLQALIKAGGQVLSREELHDAMTPNSDQAGNVRVVDVHIASLRKKLGRARALLKTVHGQGYRLVV